MVVCNRTLISANTFSIYFIEIHTCNCDIRDLVVLFDDKLTFIPHIDGVIDKVIKFYGMGYRFAADLRSPCLIIKIQNTYITPIIVYCSMVWSRKRISANKRLERLLHMASRMALRAPYHHDDINYVNFNDRLATLHLLTYKESRKIASIIKSSKFSEGEIDTELSNYVSQCRHISILHNQKYF